MGNKKVIKITSIRQDILSTIDVKTMKAIKDLMAFNEELSELLITQTIGEFLWFELKPLLPLFKKNGKLKRSVRVDYCKPSPVLNELFKVLYLDLTHFNNN